MTSNDRFGWDRLRHGGLLLDAPRLTTIAAQVPAPLPFYLESQLRRQAGALVDPKTDISGFVAFVLQQICGFSPETGTWHRGSQVGAEWTRRAVTGEAVKPRQLWCGPNGGLLPVFLDPEKRVGIGRGRRTVSQVLQWLRAGDQRLAVITNGRQWRLVFAGLDFDAWCEWDTDLWFEQGELSPQVTALRRLLSPALWTPPSEKEPAPLLQAVLDSRKGQADMSAELGERVREAVEILVQAHGEVLKERCADVAPADIYRAAVRVVMRIVVVLFAESRELLPRDNALYHGAYGITGLRESLEKIAARGTRRLARSWNAWPRVLGLFRLVFHGSHHPDLPVPAYGGELFAPGLVDAADGLAKALAVFESACFQQELMSDQEVLRLLERTTRTRVKIRQGRGNTWVAVPVDFSDLSSEYIGILYEGLLDFELKTAPGGDPVVFLALGNQPALPLSRLEAMDDRALVNLLEKMRDTSRGDDEAEAEVLPEEAEPEEGASEDPESEDADEVDEAPVDDAEEIEDERHTTRTRAEIWARKAVVVGNLVTRPRGTLTPERRLVYEEKVSRKARQLVSRVVLPGEWYLVRWGGTRKGSGTFYTRPGLAIPTVMRTLCPLVFNESEVSDGRQNPDATGIGWAPKKPEEILNLKVCDPACGSGTFLVGALRYLTEGLYTSLHHHGRISEEGDRSLVALIRGNTGAEERLCQEMLPCRPDDDRFEVRLKAVLRRHVVERCLYGVDLDPLAVELCRLALWIETMDRELPFSFLDHKIKCGNSLVGAWFDQFQHYPVMAWKNREGGDKNHSNGVHYQKDTRTKAIKAFVKERLTPDLLVFLEGKTLFAEDLMQTAAEKHHAALATLSQLHDLPVTESVRRAQLYREEFLGSEAYRSLKAAMDLWCACWFWPTDRIDEAPLPTRFAEPSEETRAVAEAVAARKRFFHWALEFPDVFRSQGSGFDAVLCIPPWDIAKPNSKEFFSNIDPLYRAYGKQEAIRYQTDYFTAECTEHEWLGYNADFRAQSNFMGYVASPYGDPQDNENSQDRFSIKRGKANDQWHARWRKARAKSYAFSDPSHPFRHQGSADINLYKLFLELAHALLRKDGRLGFIVPSGLYSDHGTGGLRTLFLERCRWEWLFGFENRNKIFQIDSRFKFNPIIVQKGGRTEAIQTAFMRRKLEDWERGESLATSYSRAQVEQFSPRSKAILEIQSGRDLEILEKIYSNSVLLGDDGPDGWGIKYSTEFHMTNDSKLFPPRPKWEEKGYRPDEYSRWLKGNWKPIDELWTELGVEPLKEGENRCAQPPYDRLPVPRAEIPVGVLLSREVNAWIDEKEIEDTALPLYEGRMIGQFDFSQKGWLSGTGRSAEWHEIPWYKKRIEPHYLMGLSSFNSSVMPGLKLPIMNIGSATNRRSISGSMIASFPCNHSLNPIRALQEQENVLKILSVALNSFVFDSQVRLRLTGLNISFFILDETMVITEPENKMLITQLAERLALGSQLFADTWVRSYQREYKFSWRGYWALTDSERNRLKSIADTVIAALQGLNCSDLSLILNECDLPVEFLRNDEKTHNLNPKGFWRVDKDKDPELRHTVLTLVAFHDLEEKIRECGGDRDKGIEAFLSQNDGEGWMLPETLRLADHGLGHDDRAKEHQPVASRLGPRFYDWQLAQSPEESWYECHLHARNLMGREGYFNLLGKVLRDTEAGRWEEALQFACDLKEKEGLLRVFGAAFGFLAPGLWRNHSEEALQLARHRGFSPNPEDWVAVMVRALKRVPEDNRAESLAAARWFVGESWFAVLIERLMSEISRRADHPWHRIIRQEAGEALYREAMAAIRAETTVEVAESQVGYGIDKRKPKQQGLFD